MRWNGDNLFKSSFGEVYGRLYGQKSLFMAQRTLHKT